MYIRNTFYLAETNVDVTVTTDDQKYDASIPIEHCPSNSGCRALITLANGNTQFSVNENFTILFKVRKAFRPLLGDNDFIIFTYLL